MLTKQDIEDLAGKMLRSPVEFCRILLPDWFPTTMPWLHRGVLAVLTGQTDFLLDFGEEKWARGWGEWTRADLDKIVANFLVRLDPKDKKSKKVPIFLWEGDRLVLHATARKAFAIPRGFSKTTLVNAINLRDILYKTRKFLLYISESAEHAEKQLGTIRHELRSNELLRMIFGNLVPERMDENKWRDDYIEPTNGVMIGAIGRGGQIRGMAKFAVRPDRIILDDVEDDPSAKSETQRKGTKTWFMKTVIPALKDIILDGDDLPDIIMIGTILHLEALLPSLEQDEEWTYIVFGALDIEGRPVWALRMDIPKLERTRRSFAAMGQLAAFYLEYMSDGSYNADAIFPENKMLYLHKGLDNFVLMAETCDPAISEKKTAAMCAFAVVGIEQGGCCHVVDSYGKVGMKPDEQVDKWFELHFRYLANREPGMNRHGIEAIAYQRALISSIQGRMFEESNKHGYGAFHEITPLFQGKQGKVERVNGILQPRYNSGYLTFGSRNPDLESQLFEWPSGLMDLPDVVAMAVKLLDPASALRQSVEHDPRADNVVSLERAMGGSHLGAP